MNVQALVASLTGIARVNKNQLYTKFHGFIDQELAQLIKCPRISPSAFCFCAWLLIRSLPNSRQIFQSDSLIANFGLLNSAETDDVICVGLEASFFAGQPLQKPSATTPTTPCAFRGFFLDRRSDSCVLISNFSYLFSTVFNSI